MHPSVKAFLTEHYKPSVHALYRLLGHDLGWEGFEGLNLATGPCEAREGPAAVAAGATVSLGISRGAVGHDVKPLRNQPPIKGGSDREEPSSLLHSRQDSANTGLTSENLSAPLSALFSQWTARCHDPPSTHQVALNDDLTMRGSVGSAQSNAPGTAGFMASPQRGAMDNPMAETTTETSGSSGEDEQHGTVLSESDHMCLQVLPPLRLPSWSSVSKWSLGRSSGEIAAAGEKNMMPSSEGRGKGAFNLSVTSSSSGCAGPRAYNP